MSDSTSEPGWHVECPARPDDLVDHCIGEFRLLRRLGTGGMAEVYLAEQPSLNRVVAVKLLRPERIANFEQSFIHRFEREAQAAGALNHPNIVQVYQTGEQDGVYFIVQEYVQGRNLAQHLRRHGPPQMDQGVQWMRQITEALQAASDAGVVHRDIKPENIMLTLSGDVKVADFGLAQLSQLSEQTSLTQTGTAMGTPLYMNPEQIRGEKVDHRSDQYSFGITCYHMFAGQPPFSATNSVTVAVRHLQDEPTPLSVHRAELPPQLCSAVHRMMAKNADQRFQTPEDLVRVVSELSSLSVNPRLQQSHGIVGWLRHVFPAPRAAAFALLITTAIGTLAGLNWFRPSQLPDSPGLNYPRCGSVAEQFAGAILNAGNESAWLAVHEYFPDTDTAEYRMAQLHLAVLYLTRVPPSPERADELLKSLADWALLNPQANRRILIQTYTGRALAARRMHQPDEERKWHDRIAQEFPREESLNTLESSPWPLLQYWSQLR